MLAQSLDYGRVFQRSAPFPVPAGSSVAGKRRLAHTVWGLSLLSLLSSFSGCLCVCSLPRTVTNRARPALMPLSAPPGKSPLPSQGLSPLRLHSAPRPRRQLPQSQALLLSRACQWQGGIPDLLLRLSASSADCYLEKANSQPGNHRQGPLLASPAQAGTASGNSGWLARTPQSHRRGWQQALGLGEPWRL